MKQFILLSSPEEHQLCDGAGCEPGPCWEQGWELKSGCYLLRLFQILWDTSKQSTNSKFCSEVSTLEAWFSLAQGLGGVTSAS